MQAPRLRKLAGVFADPEVEKRFRQKTFTGHRRRALPVFVMMTVCALGLTIRDQVMDVGPLVGTGTGIRIFATFALLTVTTAIWRARTPRGLEFAVVGGSLMLFVAVAAIHGVQPRLLPGHQAMDLLWIFAFALAFPSPFLVQSVLVIATTGLALTSQTGPGPVAATNATVLIAGCGLALLVAGLRNREERELFWARESIVHGIVRICSWCRRLADNGGRWSSFEQYITGDMNHRFSHGMCESCEETMLASDTGANLGRRATD